MDAVAAYCQIYSTQEVADALRVGPRSIRREIKAGRIQAYKGRRAAGTKGGWRWLIPIWAVVAYQQRRMAESMTRMLGEAEKTEKTEKIEKIEKMAPSTTPNP